MTSFEKILCELKYFMDDKICNEKEIETLRKLWSKYSKYDEILMMLTEQPSFINKDNNFVIYQINIKECIPVRMDDIPGKYSETLIGRLYSDNENIFFFSLSEPDIAMWLLSSKKRYSFFPVYMCKNIKGESAHIGNIVFDNEKLKVYYLDPNGSLKFFNKIKGDEIDTEKYFEEIMNLYLSSINSLLDRKYKFINSKYWNKNMYVFNKNFNTSVIGSGHCFISSVMISHYIALMDKKEIELEHIYNLFVSLTDDERLYLLSSYSSHLLHLIESTELVKT